MLQAGREACLPVQLLQLLHEDWYPEEEAVALAAQACARVLIFVKTLTSTRAALAQAAAKSREEHARAVLQRNFVIGGALGVALICIVVVLKRRQ